MLVFTEPSAQVSAGAAPAYTSCSAATSMASPSGVPLPCPSTRPTSPGATSAVASALATAAAWPPGPGTAKPARSAPSLVTAQPGRTA
ncbi:hypothetical protein B0E53_07025 [Micromonospora sp. MH33]|nr:hypothetical protein B0E53_07025 [Micromonospora sp. MH33]